MKSLADEQGRRILERMCAAITGHGLMPVLLDDFTYTIGDLVQRLGGWNLLELTLGIALEGSPYALRPIEHTG